jgi:endonuclease YncB( thermonuclease family)
MRNQHAAHISFFQSAGGIALKRQGRFPFMASFVFLLFLYISNSYADDLKGKPRIVDGDTIWIGPTKIRLHGIDAPESRQTCQKADGTEYRCGEMATFALAEIIENHWITCKGENTDRYKRRIAVCSAGPYDINAEMVGRGWALAYRRYSKDYVDKEEDASSQKVGMWQGEFMKPWEWRRQ